MNREEKRYYSIWLVAEPSIRKRLNKLIDGVREQYGGPRFESHITLPGRKSSLTETLALTARLANQFQPFTIDFGSWGYGNTYTRQVFLNCISNPDVNKSCRLAAELFEVRPDPNFFLHHSFIYALTWGDDLGQTKKEEIIRELSKKDYPKPFRVSRIDVVETHERPNGTINWNQVASFPLGQPNLGFIELVLQQGTGRINEDSILCDEVAGMFGVFDGASNLVKSDDPEPSKSGALIASETVRNTFAEYASSPEMRLRDIAVTANTRLHKLMEQHKIAHLGKLHLWSTTAGVIRLRKNSFDWLEVGGNPIIVIYKDGSFKRLGSEDYDHDKNTLAAWKVVKNKEETDPSQALERQLAEVREQANISYGLLNGEPAVENFIRHGTESLDNVATIVTMTDGMFLPAAEPQGPVEWKNWVNEYRRSGLKELAGHITALQKNDPSLKTFPRFKVSDDKAAIAIHIGEISQGLL